MKEKYAYRISVRGKVQGVFFRKYTQEKAIELGLTGTVENLADGSVLIVTEGDLDKLEQLVVWCEEGSPASKVVSVNYEVIKSHGYDGFMIKR